MLEYFSEGVEHGHVHSHDHGHTHSHAVKIPFMLLASLSLHSIIEGIPVYGTLTGITMSSHDHGHGNGNGNDNSLLLGIILHQIPVAIALMTVFISKGLSKKQQWFWLMIFGCMTPAGVILGMYITPNETILTYLIAIVVGMFLHISTTIIFESGENHKYNLAKLSLILCGGALASIL